MDKEFKVGLTIVGIGIAIIWGGIFGPYFIDEHKDKKKDYETAVEYIEKGRYDDALMKIDEYDFEALYLYCRAMDASSIYLEDKSEMLDEALNAYSSRDYPDDYVYNLIAEEKKKVDDEIYISTNAEKERVREENQKLEVAKEERENREKEEQARKAEEERKAREAQKSQAPEKTGGYGSAVFEGTIADLSTEDKYKYQGEKEEIKEEPEKEKESEEEYDEFEAEDYYMPEDFWYDHKDDFYDYEEAEEYFYEHFE